MTRIRLVAAARALKNLLRDPQDTRQVALLTAALRGRASRVQFQRFKATATGSQILAEQRYLAATLDNHEYLATLPEASFGRAYLAFMASENLTAAGLKSVTLDATNHLTDAGPDVRLFADRTRELHDLYHVLAGYGRDEIGELCVLAFSYPQQRLLSYAVIAVFGAVKFRRALRRAGIGGGVLTAIMQAYRHGRSAAWLPGEDIEALLPEDLEAVRRRLNVSPPGAYNALIGQVRAKTTWRNGPIFYQGSSAPV